MNDEPRYAQGVRRPCADEVVGWTVTNPAGEVVQWGGPIQAEMAAEALQRAGGDDVSY